jgi:hypothetical protein
MASVLDQHEVGPYNAGVNLSMLPDQISDNEAVVIQDMFLDKPGKIYSRGPIKNTVQNASTFAGLSKNVRGIFSTVAPDGTTHIASVTQDQGAANLNFSVLADDAHNVQFSTVIDSAMPTTSDCLVDAKPALGGGVWVGTQELNTTLSQTGRQCLFHWRGGTKADYATGTITTTAGSTTVNGTGTTWLANVTSGMFLMISDTTNMFQVGVVKSVVNNTQLILESPATNALTTAAYALRSIRGWGLLVAKGRISTVVGSPTVIGSGTKFLSQGLNTNSWNLVRARDGANIGGAVTSVQGEEGLTLTSNATIAMDNEPYYAWPLTLYNFGFYTISPTTNPRYFPGALNATYAGLQWFAREDQPTTVGVGDMHSRVWYSDYRNQYSIDMQSQDGDFIQVPSSVGQNLPIRAIWPMQNMLLIFKENETFAITGDSPDNFALNKILDDGCLCLNSVVGYKGTVIWCGRSGIYQFDGVHPAVNLVERSLGANYTSTMAYFDPRINKISGAVYNDTYVYSCNSNTPPSSGFYNPVQLYYIIKNGVSSNPTGSTGLGSGAIYIPTRALSFIFNLFLIGSAKINQSAYYLTQGVLTTAFYVCDFSTLFTEQNGVDYPDQVNLALSPDPYFESKRYSCKDPLRLKAFKQIINTYSTGNTRMVTEIAPGLGESGLAASWTVLTTAYANTSNVITTTRTKFLRRNRYLGIKIYNTVGAGQFGRWTLKITSIGFKWQKVGRV